MNTPETQPGGSLEPVGLERVPQYDMELKLAAAAVAQWREIAGRLYAVRGCHKNELRRIQAEAAYLKLQAPNTELTDLRGAGLVK